MPRALWKGFIKLSLVTCPVYLSAATTESNKIRLNQLNSHTGNRIQQKLVDSQTGQDVDRKDITKGYEYSKGKYVVLSEEELEALEVESSKIIEIDTFVDRDSVDQVYVDAPYFVHPDGGMAPETFRIISEAMIRKGRVGLGRVTMTSRERQVLIEPRGAGLLLSTLRSAREVHLAEFGVVTDASVDPEMITIAETIIDKRAGAFEPANFHDRYQEALQALVTAKVDGVALVPAVFQQPGKVINLMDALKRSVAEASAANANAKPVPEAKVAGKKKAASGDRRQTNLLLPVKGSGPVVNTEVAPATKPVVRSRKKAG